MDQVEPARSAATRPRRRWWAVLVVVLAAALVAGLLVVVGQTWDAPDVAAPGGTPAGTPGRTPDSGGPEASAAGRDAAVRAILDRRSAAVLERDRDAFLADLDPEADDFRAAQEQLFDNLTRLRFTTFRYEPTGTEFNRPDLAETYGVPHYVAAVLVHHQLAGYDGAPVARPQGLTFVRRDGRWLLASDTDVDRELPETGHADPWDRRPIAVREGRRALLIADRQDKGRLGALLRAADQAVQRVSRMWPDGWRQKVVVVAVDDEVVLETYFRTALQTSESVAAIAVPAYDAVPGWSPESVQRAEKSLPPRSRVILNTAFFDPADSGNRDLLTHEVTHVATQGDTRPGAPTWLVEGVAEYTAYRHLRPFALELPPSLRTQVEAGSVHLPTYEFYQRDVAANYLIGFLASAWVAERYGEDRLRTLHRRLAGTPTEAMTGQRTRTVLRKVLGVSTEQFQVDVAAYAARVASRTPS